MQRFKPRGKWVVIRRVVSDKTKGGIAVPSGSSEGNRFYVEAVGPDVGGLAVGNWIHVCADDGKGQVYPIPREKDLYIVNEKYLAIVVEEALEVPKTAELVEEAPKMDPVAPRAMSSIQDQVASILKE